jgi:hypothetical protein
MPTPEITHAQLYGASLKLSRTCHRGHGLAGIEVIGSSDRPCRLSRYQKKWPSIEVTGYTTHYQ